MDNWIDNNDPCPICGEECQNSVVTDSDGYEYNLAERCTHCKWIVRFDNQDEEIKAESY